MLTAQNASRAGAGRAEVSRPQPATRSLFEGCGVCAGAGRSDAARGKSLSRFHTSKCSVVNVGRESADARGVRTVLYQQRGSPKSPGSWPETAPGVPASAQSHLCTAAAAPRPLPACHPVPGEAWSARAPDALRAKGTDRAGRAASSLGFPSSPARPGRPRPPSVPGRPWEALGCGAPDRCAPGGMTPFAGDGAPSGPVGRYAWPCPRGLPQGHPCEEAAATVGATA